MKRFAQCERGILDRQRNFHEQGGGYTGSRTYVQDEELRKLRQSLRTHVEH